MAKLRKVAASNGHFHEACMAAVLPVRESLASRYEQLDLTGTPFETYSAATQEEMLDMLSMCVLIDAAIPQDGAGLEMKTPALKRLSGLQKWVEQHMSTHEYFVTIEKRL